MINEKLALVPSCPGCYLMKNSEGYIIYVGKSKNLKNRLSSYFKSSHTGKTKMLVSEIADFEYIITNTEIESLLLEINLIKKYDPKYNILLRDDKTYPYIELTNDIVPVLKVVRNPNVKKNKNSHIFGPYPNVKAARDVVEVINRLYPLRKCRTYQKKECLYYHIGECLGYCVHQIDDGTLKNMKNEIIAFFNGRDEILTDKIKSKMNIYSEKQEYEKALEYKKLLDNISIVLEKQKVELKDNLNRDVIGHYALNGYISITILFIRGGKLLDKTNQIFPIAISEEDSLNSYISMFYDHHKIKPNEVIVEDMVDNLLLRKLYGINFITPLKGLKKNILLLACDNAKNAYQEKMELIKRNDDQRLNAICELKEKLNVNSVSRIEIFDNSNLFGTYNVSGMVVFKDGLPLKNEYRKFKITNDVNDDYGTMKEVIYRRYFRLLKEKKQMPDLIIVDGGIGQINVAMEVIRDLNLDILVCGLKKDDKHNTSLLIDGRTKEIVDIDRKSPLFLLLTRMQDEVHNFTINYHQKLRSSSVLDNVLGIGPLRKEKLLKKYRTISKMKMADIDELKTILPDKVAENFYNFLKEI